jgi:WD40 repeat protein
VLALKDHTEGVTCVVFAADGRRLVSGSADKTVRIWDTAAGPDIRVAERK